MEFSLLYRNVVKFHSTVTGPELSFSVKGLIFVISSSQVQDKFRLDLSDEEAVHYMQSLIDESVHALFAAVVEQIHKFAQVRYNGLMGYLWPHGEKRDNECDCEYKEMNVLLACTLLWSFEVVKWC